MKHPGRKKLAGFLLFILFAHPYLVGAQTELKREVFQWIDENQETITELSDAIWEFAELPMEEYQSSRLLAETLEKSGFHVEREAAGMPTAFVATYGSGQPELGFLAEYDALPGLSQKAVPRLERTGIKDDRRHQPVGLPGAQLGHRLLRTHFYCSQGDGRGG